MASVTDTTCINRIRHTDRHTSHTSEETTTLHHVHTVHQDHPLHQDHPCQRQAQAMLQQQGKQLKVCSVAHLTTHTCRCGPPWHITTHTCSVQVWPTLAKLFDAAWCQDPRWDSMPPPGQGVCCHREQGEVGIWAHPELGGELAMRGGGEAGERRFTWGQQQWEACGQVQLVASQVRVGQSWGEWKDAHNEAASDGAGHEGAKTSRGEAEYAFRLGPSPHSPRGSHGPCTVPVS